MTETPETWQQKLAQKWWGIKLGERAENLRQANKRFNNVESLTMATREKLLGKDIVDNHRPEGEEMHVGDDNSTRNIYYPSQQQGSTMGTLAKLAIGAGLLASGVGVPVGGYLIADAIKNAPKPAPVTDTDTNTGYEVDLVP